MDRVPGYGSPRFTFSSNTRKELCSSLIRALVRLAASRQLCRFSTDFPTFTIDNGFRPSNIRSVVTFVAKSPMITTLDKLMADLKESVQLVREKEKHITGLTAAIRSLAGVCEDEDVKAEYLTALDELNGKPGFLSAIRAVLSAHVDGLTAGVIRIAIQQSKIMDLTGYSNPAASIHTTLRRMVESEEVELCTNLSGEKAYRLSKAQLAMRGAMGRNTAPKAPRPLQERFSLDHTRPAKK